MLSTSLLAEACAKRQSQERKPKRLAQPARQADGLGEEVQHHPAEEGYPCHLRADKRDGNP